MRRVAASHTHAHRYGRLQQEGSGLLLAINPAQNEAVVGTTYISDLASAQTAPGPILNLQGSSPRKINRTLLYYGGPISGTHWRSNYEPPTYL